MGGFFVLGFGTGGVVWVSSCASISGSLSNPKVSLLLVVGVVGLLLLGERVELSSSDEGVWLVADEGAGLIVDVLLYFRFELSVEEGDKLPNPDEDFELEEDDPDERFCSGEVPPCLSRSSLNVRSRSLAKKFGLTDPKYGED